MGITMLVTVHIASFWTSNLFCYLYVVFDMTMSSWDASVYLLKIANRQHYGLNYQTTDNWIRKRPLVKIHQFTIKFRVNTEMDSQWAASKILSQDHMKCTSNSTPYILSCNTKMQLWKARPFHCNVIMHAPSFWSHCSWGWMPKLINKQRTHSLNFLNSVEK